jgi:hypothetical protein
MISAPSVTESLILQQCTDIFLASHASPEQSNTDEEDQHRPATQEQQIAANYR